MQKKKKAARLNYSNYLNVLIFSNWILNIYFLKYKYIAYNK